MAFRTFRDAAGAEWHVFDVIPRREDDDERRGQERRSGEVAAEEAPGDRRAFDRRVTVGGRISTRLGDGWLCFEQAGGSHRSRLTPIPLDWTKATEEQLDTWRRESRPVGRRFQFSQG